MTQGGIGETWVLVGLMGAGKSSVGKRLAARLHVEFRDADTEIEKAAARSIPEIFADYGEAEFRKGERRVVGRLLDMPPHILATGGGAYVPGESRDLIRKSGALAIWIDASLDTLWERVATKTHRPLLQTENPKNTLGDLLETRRPAYEQADIRVWSDRGIDHEAMVDRIIEAVRVYKTGQGKENCDERSERDRHR